MLSRLRLGPFDRRSAFAVETVSVHLPAFPAAFDGFRVALLADIHLGVYVRAGYFSRVIDEALAARPDLAILAGDMADRTGRDRRRFARLIRRLTGAVRTVAVFGNHEYYHGPGGFPRALASAGVEVLVNRALTLRRGPGAVALVGLDDLTRGRPDAAAAFADVPADAFIIVLAHNPDLADVIGSAGTPASRRGLLTAPRESARVPRVGLMLCGHTHGGQIRPFGRAPVTHVRNPRYVSGLADGPGFPVYISRGLGLTGLPIRYGADPELTILTLRRA